jgi:cation diffusion facilitator CzcD-associated flavoprotein CzcO
MSALPVVVVGAGPVGLAAAAHLVEEGLDPVVFEAGARVGSSIGSWGHVRLFSPWRSNVDAAAARLLVRDGWSIPDLDALPTGRDLVDDYLVPLGRVPELRSRVRLGSRVISISRSVDKVTDDRHGAPFVVRFLTADGEDEMPAAGVVDASGTWLTPNPLGANGTPALGESQVRGRLRYGIPDVLGVDRSRHAGRTTAVVGSGHSAATSVLALLAVRQHSPTTEVHWLIRGTTLRALGGASADQLVARGRLGSQVAQAVSTGVVEFHERFPVRAVRAVGERLELVSGTGRLLEVDQIVVRPGSAQTGQ